MSALRDRFLQLIADELPELTLERTSPLLSETLISNSVVTLPLDVLKQAQDFVASAFQLREQAAYKEFLQPEMDARGLDEPGNYAIAMSYDFHLNEQGKLKLIEVNTNASFLALGDFLYKAQEIAQPVSGFQFNEIQDALREEMDRTDHLSARPRVLIIDEKPTEQRLFLEFLVYKEKFLNWGWAAEIADSSESNRDVDLIYNRDTDFYLERSDHLWLKKAWLNKELTLSPNPTEYLFLADKERLIQWNQPGFFESMGLSANEIQILRTHLPTAAILKSENAEVLWTQRKALFFKPLRSFGAKQSYRGSSISRKAFDELIGHDILAQEYIPAPELEIQTPDGPQKMKCDLRFYVYKNRVQTVLARLYQGQVTNARTPHGGFACVKFN